jgi:hypothetical protein
MRNNLHLQLDILGRMPEHFKTFQIISKSHRWAMGDQVDLASEITDPVFGSKDIFRDRTEADDLLLHRAGEKLAPELISGRYDDPDQHALKPYWRSGCVKP